MYNEITIQIGKRLITLRQKLAISRINLAADMHCSHVTLDHYEQGDMPLVILILHRLHKHYKVDLNELIGGDDDDNSST